MAALTIDRCSRRPARSQSSRRHCGRGAGFTLIELLVALLVLAIGLLGMADLQVLALRGNQASLQRTLALVLLTDLAERMRANPAAVQAGLYVLSPVTPGSAPALPTPDCRSAPGCNSAQLARFDLAEWQQRLVAALPRATARVDCATPYSASALQAITVYWDEARSGASGLDCSDDPAASERSRDSRLNLSCLRLALLP